MGVLTPLAANVLTPLGVSARRQTLLTGLISYWKLDEASGNALDAHGSNTLTATNGPTSASGKINTARQLTRSLSQYFTLTGDSSLALSHGGSSTISLWTYLDTEANSMFLLSRGSANSPAASLGYSLQYLVTSDAFRASWSTGSAIRTVTASAGVSTGTWYHILTGVDRVGQRSFIRINGGTTVYDTSTFYATALNSASLAFQLGAIGGANFHNGRIDEVGVWNRLLSDSEQLALYNEGYGFAYPFTSTLLTNLVAHWKLDEASGTRNDSHGTNHLTDNNTVTQNTGKLNYAAQFTAANSEYLSIADNPALSMGDIDFTIACWVYLDSKGTNRTIFSKGTSATVAGVEYRLLFLNSTDRLQFSASDGTTLVGVSANAFGSVPLSTWILVVCSHNAVANTIHIQVDNGSVSSNTSLPLVQDNTGAFQIGRNSNNSDYWDGRIDSVSIWKRLLTTTEKTQLYNSGAGLAYPFS